MRSAGPIASRPEVLEAFAASLTTSDRVVLEVTGNAWEIVDHRATRRAGGRGLAE